MARQVGKDSQGSQSPVVVERIEDTDGTYPNGRPQCAELQHPTLSKGPSKRARERKV